MRARERGEKCFALVRNTVLSSIISTLLPPGINAYEFIKTKRLLYLQEYENSLFPTRMQIAACACAGITTLCVCVIEFFWCIKKGQT